MLLCFEAQLGCFNRAETPDYEILEGSIAYCREYLDRWHHPREDTMLQFLQRRARYGTDAYADLEAQHLRLARTTGEVVELFEAVERDAEYPRARLVKMGQTLLDDYRRHLDWEETKFFPALCSNLLPEDWREIASLFADAADPLRQDPIDQRYQKLLSSIDEAQVRR